MNITLRIRMGLLGALALLAIGISGCAHPSAHSEARTWSSGMNPAAISGQGFAQQEIQTDYRQVLADPGRF